MTLTAGSRLGPYEIVSALGAGGMGEVYRARDTRLDREVAVKVLPEHMSASAELRSRFEREARAISSLSHPNICTLFDVGREGDTDYLVMELLEGESLQERLTQGPLPVEEVLRLGIQIADALERAHASGIVHRDLKPGNIFVTERGVKLLDFGLAKLHAAATQASQTQLGAMPTEQLSVSLTGEGMILGTFQYMAPEQLEGKEADARTDLFALGAVLYEMATGKKAFSGSSQASLIGSIMHSAPAPVSTLAPLAPPALDRVISTCLAKDPKDRWHTAHDLKLQLAWIAEGGSQIGVPAPVAARRKNREKLAWALAAVLALALAAVTVGYVRRTPVPPQRVRFDLPQPADLTTMGAPKISPDGRLIAFVGVDQQGKHQIWVRPLEALEAHPLAGTEGVTNRVRPFWSPDSRYLAYFVDSRLMKIPVDGGPPQKIADTEITGGDGTWSKDGTILFDGSTSDPIHRVEAAGGVPRVEREKPTGEQAYNVAWPQFLPDGKHFLFVGFDGAKEDNGVWLAKLGEKRAEKVVDGLSRVEYAPPDQLLFVRETTLVAQRFDPSSAKLAGEPVPVAEGFGVSSTGQADFSASSNGVLVFRAGANQEDRLTWFDLEKGAPLAGVEDPGQGHNPALSPDGRWLASDRDVDKNHDVWLRDLKRGINSRFTTDPKGDYAALFTPDGENLILSRNQGKEGWVILEKSIETTKERVLVEADDLQLPFAISPDGKQLVYGKRKSVDGKTDFDLMVTDLATGGAGQPYAATPFGEYRASFSPDGHWLVYQSSASGNNEIYVQSFPEPGRKWQISKQGGFEAVWSPAGSPIYYISLDRRLMAVDVRTRPSFDASVPQELFPLPVAEINARNRYVLSGDGKRLLAVTSGDLNAATPMTVVLNWNAARR